MLWDVLACIKHQGCGFARPRDLCTVMRAQEMRLTLAHLESPMDVAAMVLRQHDPALGAREPVAADRGLPKDRVRPRPAHRRLPLWDSVL